MGSDCAVRESERVAVLRRVAQCSDDTSCRVDVTRCQRNVLVHGTTIDGFLRECCVRPIERLLGCVPGRATTMSLLACLVRARVSQNKTTTSTYDDDAELLEEEKKESNRVSRVS
mmetsp:Transcript_9506/g.27109  ORF Transcript_9506/g.27109 Transcript_9506/m.27109 type:complete len:115 (+) Transcript_9506:1420-1764(+)